MLFLKLRDRKLKFFQEIVYYDAITVENMTMGVCLRVCVRCEVCVCV